MKGRFKSADIPWESLSYSDKDGKRAVKIKLANGTESEVDYNDLKAASDNIVDDFGEPQPTIADPGYDEEDMYTQRPPWWACLPTWDDAIGPHLQKKLGVKWQIGQWGCAIKEKLALDPGRYEFKVMSVSPTADGKGMEVDLELAEQKAAPETCLYCYPDPPHNMKRHMENKVRMHARNYGMGPDDIRKALAKGVEKN